MTEQGSALIYVDGRGRWVAPDDPDFPGGGGSGSTEVYSTDTVPMGADCVQKISLTGEPDGGTITFAVDGTPTDPIAFDADAAAAQAAFETAVGADNVVCTGGPFPSSSIVVRFTGDVGRQPIDDITTDSNDLTGGTTPLAVIDPVFSGEAIGTLTAITAIVYDTNTNGLFVNLGTTEAPDWQPVEKVAGYDANGNPKAYADSGAAPALARFDADTGRVTHDLTMTMEGARLSAYDSENGEIGGRIRVRNAGANMDGAEASLWIDNADDSLNFEGGPVNFLSTGGGDTNIANATDGISISCAGVITLGQAPGIEIVPTPDTGYLTLFAGALGLVDGDRPAIATQVGAVDVAAFNALRTALIALGVVSDGD